MQKEFLTEEESELFRLRAHVAHLSENLDELRTKADIISKETNTLQN